MSYNVPWQPVYATENEAIDRVYMLVPLGYWPGIRRCEGGFELTINPAITDQPRNGDVQRHNTRTTYERQAAGLRQRKPNREPSAIPEYV
jgi:hypothetical protein